jgi:hypothetical protein
MSVQLEPLAESERVFAEMVVGAYPLGEEGTTAAVIVPSRASLLGGVRLTAVPLKGDPADESSEAETLADELGRLLGGWFTGPILPHLRVSSKLVPRGFAAGYPGRPPEETSTAFYDLAFSSGRWNVQASGELRRFHCVSLFQPLERERAFANGGHPRPRPLGDAIDALEQAIPNLSSAQLRDRSAEHAPNVFDTYLTDRGRTVKAGVRIRLSEQGEEIADGWSSFYGIRLNVELDERG